VRNEYFGDAEWHERETHDMFGSECAGNPNLSAICFPAEFVGHPLPKSYPLNAAPDVPAALGIS
jgi:NADH-quinone oxidoreductase subunit C